MFRFARQTYGSMSYRQVWEVRNRCLHELHAVNVRVSALLRLGLQNQDASFNRLVQPYDEKYNERRDQLDHLKLADYVDEDGLLGSFSPHGDRATLLGRSV